MFVIKIPPNKLHTFFLLLCRAIPRRSERVIVSVKDILQINPVILKYINRLSDLLYILAREANKETETKEQQVIYRYFEEK